MAYVDFFMKFHTSTKRDYIQRVMEHDKAECSEVAVQYGKDYWDGAVAEIIAEACFDPAKRFKRIGIPDVFPDEYGPQDSLMARYSITTKQLVSTIAELRLSQRRPHLIPIFGSF